MPVGEEQPPSVPSGALIGTLEEFFYHGEAGLAWDTVTLLARRIPPDPVCWPVLAEAAVRMIGPHQSDAYFASWVRRAVAVSADLRDAILALPRRIDEPDERIKALRAIERVIEPH